MGITVLDAFGHHCQSFDHWFRKNSKIIYYDNWKKFCFVGNRWLIGDESKGFLVFQCKLEFFEAIPVASGEKMGFQITLFLTLAVYTTEFQQQLPVWSEHGQTPKLALTVIMSILGKRVKF